jgi:hypothetical protein
VIARFVVSLLVYPIGIVCLATLYRQPLVLAGALALLAAVTLLVSRRRGDLAVLVGGVLLGPVAEIVAVRHGAWAYATPDFLGVPLWLPVAWGLATLVIKRISEGLLELGRRRGAATVESRAPEE